jgi:SAM-dependent methyltransferase
MIDSAPKPSADQALFDSISSQYARKDLVPSARLARALRLRQTVSAGLSRDPAHSAPHILELGCGAGFSAHYLQGQYASYLGVDYSGKLIDYARHNNASDHAEFVCADLHTLQVPQRFDLILMIGVLHHLPEPAAALGVLARYLKPGGCVLANEPQSSNTLITLLRKLRKAIDPAYSKDQREFSVAELQALFALAGYHPVQVRPQGVLSTPFAEVVFKPAWLFRPWVAACCAIDTWLERHLGRWLMPISWNVIVVGRLADGSDALLRAVEDKAAIDEHLDQEKQQQD